jgi:uncharacterized protein (UPF0332 family)
VEAEKFTLADPETQAEAADIAEALRRRAISTAYYAVFHLVCQALAERITFGLSEAEKSAIYVRAYRTLDHRELKKTATRLAATPRNTDPNLKIVRNLCMLLIELYSARQSADYDPSYRVSQEEASRLVQIAEEQSPYFTIGELPTIPAYKKRLVAELLARDKDR